MMHMNDFVMLKKGCEVVCVIKLHAGVSQIGGPYIPNYNNPKIKKVIPCIKQDDKFFDLRTHKVVETNASSLVWPVIKGTVYQYPDGKQILLTKMIDGSLALTSDFKSDSNSVTRHQVKY